MTYDPHRKQRPARPAGERQSKNPYSCSGGGRDKHCDEFKPHIKALALCICIPMLTLFAILVVILLLVQLVPIITDRILE